MRRRKKVRGDMGGRSANVATAWRLFTTHRHDGLVPVNRRSGPLPEHFRNGLVPVHCLTGPVPAHRRDCLALNEEDKVEEKKEEVVSDDKRERDTNTAPFTTHRQNSPVANPSLQRSGACPSPRRPSA